MTYGKLSGIIFLGFILVSLPESVGFSYVLLFTTLGTVAYLRKKNKENLNKKSGFLQKIYKGFCYFFLFWLSLLVFALPAVKEEQKKSQENIELGPVNTGTIDLASTEIELPHHESDAQKETIEPQKNQPQETQKPTISPSAPVAESPVVQEQQPQIEPQTTERISYTFVSVVDGDTIKAKDTAGKTQSVRMIGLDTPESSTARYGYIECFGKEATSYLKSLLGTPKTVELEFDPTQTTTDKYGRLLAYVWHNGMNLNQKMIEDGYGFEYTYNLPYKYQSEFKSAQKSASENRLGLWADSACAGDRKKGTQAPAPQQPTPAPQVEAVAPQEQAIISSSERVYHRGRRGGCYYITSSGGKEYVDRSLCN